MATVTFPRKVVPRASLGWQVVEGCERAAAALLLAATAPLQLALAGVIAASTRRPPWIAHQRVGQHGRVLWVLKLRTLSDSRGATTRRWVERIEDDAGPAAKSPSDSRVASRFARFCRRHSLDELPQLWQVVRGEMALIGPRPLTRWEIREHYTGEAEEILSVKPGIAGLWQTSGRNRLSYSERRELDLRFVRERSAAMYLKIVLRVGPEILLGKNAW